MLSGFKALSLRQGSRLRAASWALPLLVSTACLGAGGDLSKRPFWFFGCMITSALALCVASIGYRRRYRQGQDLSARALLITALLLRTLLLPLAPTLSNDVYRYLWDGRVACAGYNPYRLPPEAAELEPLRDAGWQALHHRDVETVYPPAALLLFMVAAVSPLPLLTWKGLLVLLELLGCALLYGVAARAGKRRYLLIWYAWNPLVVLEVAGMGHVDGAALPAVAATVLVLVTRRRAGASDRVVVAGLSAALGVLVKLVPSVALPMWCRQSRKPVVFAATCGLLLVVGLGPLLWAVRGLPPGLVRYGISWEFNGAVYDPLWRAIDLLEVDSIIKQTLDDLKRWTGRHELWNSIYPWVYPQLLAKALLAMGLVVVVVFSLRQHQPIRGLERTLGGALLLSATLYPWYLLWVLPWASLEGRWRWLVLSQTVLLSYAPQHYGVRFFPGIYLAVWLPFAATAALAFLRSRHGARRARDSDESRN